VGGGAVRAARAPSDERWHRRWPRGAVVAAGWSVGGGPARAARAPSDERRRRRWPRGAVVAAGWSVGGGPARAARAPSHERRRRPQLVPPAWRSTGRGGVGREARREWCGLAGGLERGGRQHRSPCRRCGGGLRAGRRCGQQECQSPSRRANGRNFLTPDSFNVLFDESELAASGLGSGMRILHRIMSRSRPAFDAAKTQVAHTSKGPFRGPGTMHVGSSDTETNPCPVVTTRKL